MIYHHNAQLSTKVYATVKVTASSRWWNAVNQTPN